MKKRAFTLIELMIVIGIIGILATLGVTSFSSAVKKSRDAKQKSDVSNIQQALILYRSDNGTYPNATNSLVSTYLKAVPANADGAAYTYTALPAGCTGSGSSRCVNFVICTQALEAPKGNANSTSMTPGASFTPCNNTDNSVASGACKYFCLTNP